MKFYVYEWFIKNTNEVFYVGKGSNNRYKVRKHNYLFNYILENNICDSRIIKEFNSEKEAFEYECNRINELWSKGQCKANIYKGGMGGTTDWWTKELRKKYSEQNVMKSQEQRKRMSINNPMKNVQVKEKVASKISKKVIINEIVYNSVLDVCNKYKVTYATVKKWCDKGVNHLGEQCRYEGQEQVIFEGRRYNKGGCKNVIYNGKIYECPIDISTELGINKHNVYKWVKKGFDNNGNICRYVDDNRELTYKKSIIGESNRKPIEVNGIIYNSKREAEEKLKLKKGYLAPYINGTRKNKNYICKYVNQQPSHENSDKSIVEGSTTNE